MTYALIKAVEEDESVNQSSSKKNEMSFFVVTAFPSLMNGFRLLVPKLSEWRGSSHVTYLKAADVREFIVTSP